MKIQYETDDVVRIRVREEFVGTVVHAGTEYVTVHDGTKQETVRLDDVVGLVNDCHNVVAPFSMTDPAKSTNTTDSTEKSSYRFQAVYAGIGRTPQVRYLNLDSSDLSEALRHFGGWVLSSPALTGYYLKGVCLMDVSNS